MITLVVTIAMTTIGILHTATWAALQVDRLVEHLIARDHPPLPPATVRSLRRARKRLKAQLPGERMIERRNTTQRHSA